MNNALSCKLQAQYHRIGLNRSPTPVYDMAPFLHCACVRSAIFTDESYTDAELARVSVLTLDVTKTAYVSPVASVWQVS